MNKKLIIVSLMTMLTISAVALKTSEKNLINTAGYQRQLMTIATNDTYKDSLWGLDNTGQTVNGQAGTANADIRAVNAWTISQGTTTIVAVIDDGVSYNHPDLANNMWDGSACKDENGGALGGCLSGYDFENNDNDPLPTSGTHGTEIAGVIAAESNNNIGITGLSPFAKIMAVKTDLTEANNVKAIDFARQNGAKIIVAAFAGSTYSTNEYDAINRFRTAGGLFITVAGNGGADAVGDNNNTTAVYPCNYNLDNIICVASTDANDALASFSNYGKNNVAVAAPGVNIYTTASENIFTENFEEPSILFVAPSNMGLNFTSAGSGTWTRKTLASGDTVAYGDNASFPYGANKNSTLTSSAIDLTTHSHAYLTFDYNCSTEPTNDYLSILGYDGASFVEIDRISGASSGTKSYPLNSVLNNFQFQFLWHTNGTVNNYDGCWINNVIVTDPDSATSNYDFVDGTSMSAAYTAGLVSLISGYNPNLNYTQIKDVILTTGDAKASLNNKTISGKRINAYNALNLFQPHAGTTVNNVISSSTIYQANDGTGLLTINFKAQDGLAGVSITANNFQYSTDGGATWAAPVGGDSSAALSSSWNNNGYTASSSYAAATNYSFTLNTKHANVAALNSLGTTTAQIRFQISDGATSSPYTVSDNFNLDNTAPVAPVISAPAAPTTLNANTYIISGTAEADALVKIYNASNSLVASQQLTGGSTAYAIITTLQQNATNTFSVLAVDTYGNIGASTTAPAIVEDSTAPTMATLFSLDNNTATTTSMYISTTTPVVDILGEAGMSCRWDMSNLTYSASNPANEFTVVGTSASSTLGGLGVDGAKTIYVNCKDSVGNEQATSSSLVVNFYLDTTAPSSTAAIATPNPTTTGTTTITINLSDVGGLDYTVDPVVTITGLASSPYAVTKTSYAGGVWTGTFNLLNDGEEAIGTINVTGVQDLAGNIMIANPTAGTFTVDTLAPTALLTGTPADPDNSAIANLDVTISGAQVLYYKYSLSGSNSIATSSAISTTTHIIASNLLNGTTTLAVIGQDAMGNWQAPATATTYTWVINDLTAPIITGLTNDATTTATKVWTWNAADATAQFSYGIDQSATGAATSVYSSSKTISYTPAAGVSGTYYLHVVAKDNNNNISATTTVSASLNNPAPVVTSGGGGGGSYYSAPIVTPTTTIATSTLATSTPSMSTSTTGIATSTSGATTSAINALYQRYFGRAANSAEIANWIKQSPQALDAFLQSEYKKVNAINTNTTNALALEKALITTIEKEAKAITVAQNKKTIPFGYKGNQQKEVDIMITYVGTLIDGVTDISSKQIHALTYFIAYGTPTTNKMTLTDRVSALQSYKLAFKHLPSTEKQWQDVLKIALGRTPAEKNAKREKDAAVTFKKIYQRTANMKNSKDVAAINILSYGMLPIKKDLKAEAAGTKSFKAIYKRSPKSNADWIIVRAIAYSGTKR